MNATFHRPSNLSALLYSVGISFQHVVPLIPVPMWGTQLLLALCNAVMLFSVLLSQQNTEHKNEPIADVENVPANTPVLIPGTIYDQMPIPLYDQTQIPTQPATVVNSNEQK